eukprot:gb/GEZN01005941.1/.p1 GENE.gb/GEZN01005941.1/~~gb/GEZN01005941.1/.p1  ORF type:complete len:370 (-),score=67.34 gb/GEZN01005941.1/:108-1217(-)
MTDMPALGMSGVSSDTPKSSITSFSTPSTPSSSTSMPLFHSTPSLPPGLAGPADQNGIPHSQANHNDKNQKPGGFKMLFSGAALGPLGAALNPQTTKHNTTKDTGELTLESWLESGTNERVPPTAKRSLEQLQRAGLSNNERVFKLVQLQKSLGMNSKAINLLDNPQRRLLFLGDLSCSGLARRFIVFEDLLVIAARQRMGSGLDLVSSFPLTPALAMKDMPDRKGKHMQNRIRFITPTKTYSLSAKNASGKAKLISAFNTALQEFYVPPYDLPSSIRRISTSQQRASKSLSQTTFSPARGKPAHPIHLLYLGQVYKQSNALLATITANEERLAQLRKHITQEESEIASLRNMAQEIRIDKGYPIFPPA